MDFSFSWTTGGDPAIRHEKALGSGGYADVHEMVSNNGTGEVFARKLIRMSGRSPQDCIRNEAEVVASICRNGGHQNIIRVLRHGWLGGSVNVYFIDMELASLTLEEYLDYQRNLETPGVDVEALAASHPVFIHKDCSPIEQIENVWAIGMHIARGLEFMHSLGHVHRDLKPSNVLYCPGDNLWKLTDFGLTANATTTRAQPTRNARGTVSYRAPEMLSEEPVFTNRFDMWGLGCVLHRLATKRAAFRDDFAVERYNRVKDSVLEIKVTSSSEFLQHHVSENIRALLQRDPRERPSAALASRIFSSYCQILELPCVQAVCDTPLYPTHQQWQQTVDSHLSKPEILSQLALGKLFEESGDSCLARSLQDSTIQAYECSERHPQQLGGSPNDAGVEITPLYKLGKLLTENDRDDESIVVYQKLLDRYPADVTILTRLAEVYTKMGKDDEALSSYRMAAESQPTNFWLWRNFCGVYVRAGDDARAIEECIKALKQFPFNISLALLLVTLHTSLCHYSQLVRTYMSNICAQEDIQRNWLSAISHDAPDTYSEEVKEMLLEGYIDIEHPHSVKAATSPFPLFPEHVNTDGRSLRPHSAAIYGYKTSLITAIERGEEVNVSEAGWTPLHLAVWNMHLDAVKILLKSPQPGIATKNIWGWTALHLASWNNDVAIIEVLLEAGAKVSVCHNKGYTPVHVAASNESVDAIGVLWEAGANVSAPSDGGDWVTPLHIAATRGNVKTIEALLEFRADGSACDKNGRTPFHYAARKGKVEVIRALMGAGPDVCKPDCDGNSAMHYANETVVADIRKALEEESRSSSSRDSEDTTLIDPQGLKEVGDLMESFRIGD